MKLIRYQSPTTALAPLAGFQTVADEMNRLFDLPYFGRLGRVQGGVWVPAFDVYEDSNAITLRAELPGIKKDQLQITLLDGVLTIAGERRDESGEGREVIRRERVFGRFERSVTLQTAVNEGAIKATFENGILTVVLPKAEEAKPRQIAIE